MSLKVWRKEYASFSNQEYIIFVEYSGIQYHEFCNLIGYATYFLFRVGRNVLVR